MTILFLSHLFPNPGDPILGNFVFDLARFVNRRVQVIAVAPVPYFPFMTRFEKYRNYKNIIGSRRIDGLEIKHPRFFMLPRYWKWLDGPFYLLGCASTLYSEIKKCDVVVAHWTFPDAFAGLFFSKLLRKKIILVVHGNESIHYFDPPSFRKMLVNYTIRRMDHIIPVSQDLQKKLISSCGIPVDRMTVITNGVDFDLFPAQEVQVARHSLNLPSTAKIILCVARLSKEKALLNLLQAFKALCYNNSASLRLYCLGEGPEREKLESYIEKNSLDGKVFLPGNVSHDRIHLWMSASDIFVLPSLWEGTPVVIGEAFACGLPVVASEVGGIPDLFVDDRLGILVAPNSVPLLVDAMHLALEAKWDRKYIRQHGLSLSWERIADSLLKRLKKIIPPRSGKQ